MVQPGCSGFDQGVIAMGKRSGEIDVDGLAEAARSLLAAHHRESPLILPNVWDAASARVVEGSGFEFVATSSHAVADVLGEPDGDSMDPGLAFDWTGRIARSVSCPVTADLEAGYRLGATELVTAMLTAGAVGCNLEDSDHHGDGALVDADRQASFLAAVRAAADAVGVPIVLNARVDTFVRPIGDDEQRLAEAVRRGRLYLEAGADCVYPIGVAAPAQIATLVEALPGPVNVLPRRGGLSLAQLAELGVRRISLAASLHRLVTERLRVALDDLRVGHDLDQA
jgi:2-methylisocitrate lyase-like PEP mutase family enzyme